MKPTNLHFLERQRALLFLLLLLSGLSQLDTRSFQGIFLQFLQVVGSGLKNNHFVVGFELKTERKRGV